MHLIVLGLSRSDSIAFVSPFTFTVNYGRPHSGFDPVSVWPGLLALGVWVLIYLSVLLLRILGTRISFKELINLLFVAVVVKKIGYNPLYSI